jgi:hypothetical protein
LLGGVLRVNLQSRKTRHSSHGLDSVTDSLIEYLTDIGSRVGTDKQNTLPSSARRIAVAQEIEVLPTPPLPVKTGKTGYSLRISYVLLTYSTTGSFTTTATGGS